MTTFWVAGIKIYIFQAKSLTPCEPINIFLRWGGNDRVECIYLCPHQFDGLMTSQSSVSTVLVVIHGKTALTSACIPGLLASPHSVG